MPRGDTKAGGNAQARVPVREVCNGNARGQQIVNMTSGVSVRIHIEARNVPLSAQKSK